MNKLISKNITDAVEFALDAHKNQSRKDDRPFIIHPLSVAFILLSVGYSEDVVIAGILHDVVEDTKYTERDIKERFGEKVAYLVMGVTEDKSIKDWQERKASYLEHLKTANSDIQAISAADLLDNRRAILKGIKLGTDIWKNFNATPEMIMKNSIERLSILKYLDNQITKELEVVINEINNILGFK